MEKVLVVDDDTTICDFLKMFIKRLGYDVDVATTGAQTLQKLNEMTRPSLILLDIVLPDADGWKILKEIRNRDEGIKVIIMTGYHSDYEDALRIIEVVNLGVETCLSKPFDLDKLEEAIFSSLSFSKSNR